MKRCIIGLLTDPQNTEEFDLEGHQNFGLDCTEYTYLDGAETIHCGEAASTVDKDTHRVEFDKDTIWREEVVRSKTVATRFFADIDAGFVTVDSSDGTFLWDRLQLRHGPIERAALELDDWRENLSQMDKAQCWQLGWDHPDEKDVGVQFHQGARFDHKRDADANQLGFAYMWNGKVVRGTAAESGYVAVFDGVSRPADVGRWLREEVLPYAYVPDDEDGKDSQATLGEAADD